MPQTCYKSLNGWMTVCPLTAPHFISALWRHFCRWITTSFPLFLYNGSSFFSLTLLTLQFAAVSHTHDLALLCTFVRINFTSNIAWFSSNFLIITISFAENLIWFAFPAASFNYSYLCQLLIDTGDFKQRIFHSHVTTTSGQRMIIRFSWENWSNRLLFFSAAYVR